MAENVTLAPLTSLTNDTSAIATINANSVLIENAFADCLALSGEAPNAMEANLDMNNFNILNLPSPSTINSPIRVTDLNTFSSGGTITLNPLPVGGTINSILHKNSSTNQDATWTLTPSGLTSIGATSSTVITSNVTGTSVYTGSSSGTTTLQATAIASGTLTLPAATDTLVGKATTDTLTNKTLDTAGIGNVIKFGGVASSTVTGTGAVVLANSPTLITPNIGAATGISLIDVGKISSASPTAGIGYSTGAGLAVTQLTSKTTGVTINSVTGQITMNNASLASTVAGISFTVTNSAVAATDIIIVNINSIGATAGAYSTQVHSVQAGSFAIKITNTSGGALVEAVVLNFAVIKGVAS